ncbi:MAG: phosphoadenosine phosphosulfate reductase family protein [Granulosicoccus sp.]
MSVSDKAISLNYNVQLAAAKEAIHTTLASCRNPILTTKFTEDSAVLLHLVTQICPQIPVLWIDTGYNTRATLAYSKQLCARLQLSLHTYHPDNHTIIIPPELNSPAHSEFVSEVKLEPFGRALSELRPDAWLSSIRRYQSPHRSTLSVFDVVKGSILKVSPLLEWPQQSMDRYLQENDLPSGPSCFDPTKGEPFRECGLHVDVDVDFKDSYSTHGNSEHHQLASTH